MKVTEYVPIEFNLTELGYIFPLIFK